MSNEIVLDGYRPVGGRWPIYLLRPDIMQVETRWFDDQRGGRELGPKSGTGDFRNVGGWLKRRAVFIALYANEGRLYVVVDDQKLEVMDKEVAVRRTTDVLLRKRFVLYSYGRVIVDVRYSYLDNEDVPDQDIFSYLERSLRSRESCLRALLIWQDKASGINQTTAAYFSRLTERVHERLTSGTPE
jgi:hypothetical protein